MAVAIVRVAMASYAYKAWEWRVKFHVSGFFQGRLEAVLAALIVGPLLLLVFGALARSDDRQRWVSASGALLGIGLAAGPWFLLLGLRGAGAPVFLAIGAILAIGGCIAGAVGWRTTKDLPKAPAWDVALEGWKRTRLQMRGAWVVALIASVGVTVAVLATGTATAQLIPAIVVALTAVALLVPPSSRSRWEVVAGAWFGIGVTMGAIYLFVGVFYIPSVAARVQCVCYLLLVGAGRLARRGVEAGAFAEARELRRTGRDHPARSITHEHEGPLLAELPPHLHNLHGVEAPPMDPEEREAFHRALHGQPDESEGS